MKKVRIFGAILIMAMLLLCLCGCVNYQAPQGNTYVRSDPWAEVSYTLDSGRWCLEYDGVAYPYVVRTSGRQITYSVTYPNDAVYSETREGDSVQSHWEGEYPKAYTSGETLVEVLDDFYYLEDLKPHFLNWLGAMILIAIGLFGAFYPRAAWELEHMFKSWQYQSIEPTDDALLATRFGGVFGIAMGIVFFFLNWQ